jgi:hypothetical protein
MSSGMQPFSHPNGGYLMRQHFLGRAQLLSSLAFLGTLARGAPVQAQPVDEPAHAVVPSERATLDAAAPPAEASPPEPALAPEAPVVAAEPAAPAAIHMSFFTRVGFRLQDPGAPKKLNDLSVDTANITPGFSGNAFDKINWTATFFAVAQTTPGSIPPAGGNVTALDLIAQLDLDDAFHVWAGRMIIPSDRSGFSGPFFMSAWNYPGVYSVGGAFALVAPKADYLGRGVGATVWGQFQGGLLKYFAGAYQLDQGASSPLFTGRLNLSLISPEPGYYSSSSYFGSQERLAIGIGVQAQKNGSNDFVFDPATGAVSLGAADNYSEFNLDVLAEFNVGGGTLTGEGAFYAFGGAASSAPVDVGYFVLASYLLPQAVGVGRLQPLLRYQGTHNPDMNMLDVFLGYIIKGPALRFHVGYQRTDMGGGVVGNALQLGGQILQL